MHLANTAASESARNLLPRPHLIHVFRFSQSSFSCSTNISFSSHSPSILSQLPIFSNGVMHSHFPQNKSLTQSVWTAPPSIHMFNRCLFLCSLIWLFQSPFCLLVARVLGASIKVRGRPPALGHWFIKRINWTISTNATHSTATWSSSHIYQRVSFL